MTDIRWREYFAYIKEREAIRTRREMGQDWPWTDDLILQEYKFTNVHREHDRTSRELIDRFYSPNESEARETILLNAVIYRWFGTWEFASALGWTNWHEYDHEAIKMLAHWRMEHKYRVFTGAYVITNGGILGPKVDVIIDYYLTPFRNRIPELIDELFVQGESHSWERMAKMMSSSPGFGGTGFMTKEVLLDTTYTNFWWVYHPSKFAMPSDWWTWTPVGPGARRGAARILGDDTAKPISAKHSLDLIISLVVKQDEIEWSEGFKRLCPHDIQFGLCEFDKYERVRLGQGRPRSRYRRPQ